MRTVAAMRPIPLLLQLLFFNTSGLANDGDCTDPQSNTASPDSCTAEVKPPDQNTVEVTGPDMDPSSQYTCSGHVILEDLTTAKLGENCVFFLETSSRKVVSSREACSLESAAKNSGLRVVMLRMTNSLDLSDNTTCNIYNRFRGIITFLYIDPVEFSSGTPLQEFFTGPALEDSMNRPVHTADALRLLVIHKFGGFYSDTDVVFLRSLIGLKDVIASDQVMEERYNSQGELLVGDTVTNAIFHFSKGAKILEMAIKFFKHAFQSHMWASGGPDLLHRCLLLLCGFPQEIGLRDVDMTRERFSRENCGGIQVLDYKSFYPMGWMQQSDLTIGRSKKEWDIAFSKSYAVHFYHTSSHNSQKIKRPKYYGARKPAYLALALEHCPVAYWSNQLF